MHRRAMLNYCARGKNLMTMNQIRMARRGAACIVLLSLVVACENDAKLKDIQKKADERVAQAEKDAKDKVASLQKQLDEAKAEFATAAEKAKAEADNAIAAAKETADEGAKDAADALAKAREAYKAEARSRLKSVNQDLQEVSVRASRAPAKLKPTVDKAMKAIVAKQKDVAKDIAAYDAATLDTFRNAKAKVDADLAAFKRDVLGLKSKLPP